MKILFITLLTSFIKGINILCVKRILLVLGFISCISAHAEKIFYAHPDLHLWFTLDTETKEALLGRGEAEEHNALNYPSVDDDWWMNGQQNLWETLVIPENLMYAEEEYKVVGVQCYAFYKTTAVRKISLPESIRTIGDYAFAWCTYLEEINIPIDVTEIGTHAFELCVKIEKFDIPNKVVSIGSFAFSDCSGLKEVIIPASCNKIGDEAFTWCTSLSKIIIEDGINTLNLGRSYNLGIQYEGGGTYTQAVERGMFADSQIDTLYVGRNIYFPNSGRSPFGCMRNIGYDNSGNAILKAEGQSFDLLQFGDLVTEIPNGIFAGAIIKNKIELPKNIQIIGDYAFNAAIEQIKIDLPASLEYIGVSALTGLNKSDGIRFVTCHSDKPVQIQDNSFNNLIVAYVPFGTASLYRTTDIWKKYKIIDDSDELLTINVKTAGTLYSRLLAQDFQTVDVLKLKLKGTLNEEDWNVVKEMTKLYELDLSELSLSELPTYALKGKSSLISIKFPSTITSIPDSMFNGCRFLSGTIVIPETCRYVGKDAFSNTSIEEFIMLGNVTIGERAFWNNKALLSINLVGEDTNVGCRAFALSSIRTAIIGKGVKVEDEAFWYCKSLESVIFEDGVESIGTNVFDGCNLKEVTFNGLIEVFGNSPLKTVKDVYITDIAKWCKQKFSSIENSPLYYADHLFIEGEEVTDLIIPNTVNRIENYSFYNRKMLQNITLSEGVESIGECAFYGCSNIKQIQMPSTLRKIDNDAFYGCEKLSELEFPLNIDTIGIRAFSSCSNLTKLIAHWENPFTIDKNTFYGVSSDCCLYIPILTASKYVNAGWNVPNMKEAGIINIIANSGGEVSYNGQIINGTGQFLFSPYKSFTLSILPNEGYSIKKVKLNGENVTSMIESGGLLIEEPEENLTVSIIFADNRIKDGDVNGDGVINKTDAIILMEHIVKKTPETFFDYASDLDDNDVINITDGLRIIYKLINEN